MYEEKPDLHVISAGSLLEAKIEREGFSFPVGRVEFCYLYPLDFFEYLEAKGEIELLKILKEIETNIADPIHQLALSNFYEYAMIGGMPEIVAQYLKHKDLNQLKTLFSSLFTGYLEDVFKYASQAEAKYLSYIIETSPLFAGSRIIYEKFGGANFRSREMHRAFSTLEKIMLLHQVRATSSLNLPFIPKEKRPKKLIYLDCGLVNYRMNILSQYLNLTDFDNFYQGRIAEQIVGQNLFSLFMNILPEIYYWARERAEGSAEIDFCLNLAGRALGIEVKSGKVGKLKSLLIFGEKVPKSSLIRIYSGKLKVERFGKFNLLSIPFYLTPRIFELVQV
ncbi:MAG: ATP-binding protein [Candidatus Margulisiibacteriota bacterium]